MRLYIAGDDDNLRRIAMNKNIALHDLAALNPHIADPLATIAGQQIKLPPHSPAPDTQAIVPACSIQLFNPKAHEQWIPLTTLDKMQQEEYDVLIVGTGAGGGAMLRRLTQQLSGSGKRIGVLERGGLLLPTHAQNIETMTQSRLFDYYATSSHFIGPYLSGQIYALGGRTLFWAATSPRMPASEIARWPVPLSEMEWYYGLAEQELSVTSDFTKGAAFSEILLRRLRMNGIKDATEEPLAFNLAPVNRFGVMNSNPVFSSIHFLAKALNTGYDLAINSRVVKVLVDHHRCCGVEVVTPDKKRYVIRAKNVVLSASTFGSAQILLHSDLPGLPIGRYMTNHSRVIGFGQVSRSEFQEELGPLRLLVPGRVDRPYQLQIVGPGDYAWIQYAEQPLQEKLNVVLGGLGEVEARYDNYVALDPAKTDADGVPELNIHFTYSDRDEAVIRRMSDGIKEAAAAMQLTLNATEGPSVCRLRPGADIHEMGTCRMGNDPLTSVTDQYGKVHGVQGLYVADNSVIPTSGTANPTLTTVALALRTADEIIRQLK